jgi:argininosuccinate lyase
MSSKLWGGRFSKEVDASITGWTESVTIDSKMVVEDIWGSMAHVAMLGVKGIIPPKDAAAILSKLLEFQDGYVAGSWQLQLEREDVHMNVEARLIDALSIDIGGKMHTGRSRNDQVVLDSKLYTRRRLLELRERLLPVIETLLERAGAMTEDVMSSYTHVQHAQPISVAYWLSHYAAVFLRDLDRLKRAYDLTDENPLGSGAIAGTSFPIDRELTKDLLGFQKVHEHGLDATSARDFMLEVLSASAILSTTASRPGGGVHLLVLVRVPDVDPRRRLRDGLVDDAAEEEPRHRRAHPRPVGADERAPHGWPHDDEGAAERIQPRLPRGERDPLAGARPHQPLGRDPAAAHQVDDDQQRADG